MTTSLMEKRTARSTIQQVDLSRIQIDLRVQRTEGIDQRRVNTMADNFNPEALGLLILSQRGDGSMICLDGMHRAAVAVKAGWSKPVDARVFAGLTLAEEAALFLLYNDKRDPSAISRFKARVLAGDEAAVDIDRIIRKCGWHVSTGKESGSISAVASLDRVYRTAAGTRADGKYPTLTEQTMVTITRAWGRDPLGAHGSILQGVTQLYSRFSSAIDTEKLIREMQDTQPRVLLGRANTLKDFQGGTVPAALAKLLAGMHDSRRRSNLLPDWVWVK